jgi:hypothetical protein
MEIQPYIHNILLFKEISKFGSDFLNREPLKRPPREHHPKLLLVCASVGEDRRTSPGDVSLAETSYFG